MIKLKEIPIGDLTTELLNNQHVYCKRGTSGLYRVIDNTEMHLKDIEKVKFYIEDTSYGESIYEQLVNQIIADYGSFEDTFGLGRRIDINLGQKGHLEITYLENPFTKLEDNK